MAKVLVVDDSPTVRAYVKSALTKHGHEVESLSCFVELAGRLEDAKPDVVVLDLNLPAMPGESLGDFLRRYQGNDIGVVIFSGEPEKRLAAAARRLGAAAWVQKSGGDDIPALVGAVERAAKHGHCLPITGIRPVLSSLSGKLRTERT